MALLLIHKVSNRKKSKAAPVMLLLGGDRMTGYSRRVALLAFGAAAVLSLSACKIVAISDQDATDKQGFDAKVYADKIWTSKALPHFAEAATPLPEVIAAVAEDLDAAGQKYGYRAATEGSPWTFIVKGQGIVAKKNTESRAGTLTVTLEGGGEATLQIGPVVKGSAIRDALPFVSFKDFTNQLEFADVGKALTALALAAIGPDVATESEGKTIIFDGAITLNSKVDKILVTPVSIKAVP